MKCVNKEIDKKGRTVLVTETDRFLRKPKVRKFVATETVIRNKYWTWRELPDMTLVPDVTSFQLDAWMKEIV